MDDINEDIVIDILFPFSFFCSKDSQDAVKFLLDNGADANPKYHPGNNS